jgi:hypothetical protein
MYNKSDLMPKRYPENKPSKEGVHICHAKYCDDSWSSLIYKDGYWGAGYDIDWFIDIRLDKEEDVSDKPKITRSGDAEFTEICKNWLDIQGYDVVKREPEIAPCPNPECRSDEIELMHGYHGCYVYCHQCRYSSPCKDIESEAIRLHNALCNNTLQKVFSKHERK